MSIYIKGMEMPKDCDECWTKYHGFGWVEHDEEWGTFYCKPAKGFCSDPRTKCPIVSVPPHGRLIGANEQDAQIEALIERHLHGYTRSTWDFVCQLRDILKRSPTIIPASDD